MNLTILILLITTSLQNNSVGPVLNIGDDYTIYSIGKTNYVLTKDSVYYFNKNSGWVSKKHFFQLETYDLQQVKDKKSSYLINRGLGKVYKIERDTIYSIDNSFEWKSRYFSYNFIRNNVIHSYGGYGFYSIKNNIIYFDTLSKEWSNLNTKNSNKLFVSLPSSNYDQKDDMLYVLLGFNIVNGENILNLNLSQFNFKTNEWDNLKKINKNILNFFNSPTRFSILNYRENVFFNRNFFGEINVKKGKFKVYNIHNNLIDTHQKILFNEINDEFFIAFERNKNDKLNFSQISKYDLLGNDFKEYKLYQNNYNYYLIFVSITLLITILIFIIRRRRRRNIYILLKKDHYLDAELNENEKILKNKLIEIYPKDLTFPEITILLNLNLTYESNIKKTKKLIKNLDHKIKKKFKTKTSVLIISRNELDKRIKQVRIN